MRYAIGMDLGGTASRALVVDASGRRLGRGRAGGGNPVTHGPGPAAEALRDAVRAALADAGVPPGDVAAGHAAMAGYSLLRGAGTAAAQAREAFEATWRGLGADGPLRLGYDIDAAFAAGTPEPAGTALIAGTGTVGARVRDHAVHRTVGGRGWLLGDEGSGFWLGREAVRALLDVDEGAARPGALTRLTARRLLGEGVEADKAAVVGAVRAAEPIALARLAPLVAEAVEAGDPVAARIADRAADHLAGLAAAARDEDERSPVVLAGGVLSPGGPVAAALRRRLARRWPQARVGFAAEGEAGAAWLAARRVAGAGGAGAEPDADARLHAVIVGKRDG